MTPRAIVVGLLASALFAAVGFFNDMVMKQTFLFSSYLPAFVYGLVLLFVLIGNPLLARASPPWGFSRAELATIIVLTLPACFVSGRTLVHHFPGVIVTVRHYNQTQLGWQRYDLLRRVPPLMLAGYEPEYTAADILQPDAVVRRLATAEGAGEPRPALETQMAAVYRSLAPPPGTDPTPAGVAATLNAMLGRPGLVDPARLAPDALPAEARHLWETGFANPREQRRCNRLVLDSVLDRDVRSLASQDDAVVLAFQRGMGGGQGHVSPAALPWGAWVRPLFLFWLPLLLALCVAYIGFALFAHRQWAEHEHLPFPIAEFSEAILPDPGSSGNRTLFHNRLFWMAAGAVAVFHLHTYAAEWWSLQWATLPRQFNLYPLAALVPFPWESWRLLEPIVYFTIVGFAYCISTETSLSAGVAPYAYALLAGLLARYGVVLGAANWNSTRTTNYVMLGGFAGMFLMLLYYGRQHFASVARRCLGLRARDAVHTHEYWGARVFVLASLAFVLLLRSVGVDLVWGTWYLLMLVVVYAVVARIVAETGMILIHPVVFPGILATGFFGERLVGINQLVPLTLVSTVIGVGCHVVMLPLMTQGLRMVKGHEGKAALWCTLSLVISLVVGVLVTTYLQYDYGAASNDDGWTRWLPASGLEAAEKVANRLDALGWLEGVGRRAPSPGLAALACKPACVTGFGLALVGVLAFEVLRLRCRWWPFHPIVFVVLDFWLSRQLAASFLIGWVIKVAVCRYGGAGLYRRLKPAMLGLIAGDILGQVAITVVCTVYSLSTGSQPRPYWVLPG